MGDYFSGDNRVSREGSEETIAGPRAERPEGLLTVANLAQQWHWSRNYHYHRLNPRSYCKTLRKTIMKQAI